MNAGGLGLCMSRALSRGCSPSPWSQVVFPQPAVQPPGALCTRRLGTRSVQSINASYARAGWAAPIFPSSGALAPYRPLLFLRASGPTGVGGPEREQQG